MERLCPVTASEAEETKKTVAFAKSRTEVVRRRGVPAAT